ncbi:MAG TPA: sigma-70 family RNA polymerase sigma factor [Acidimicrobiia bacterium]|nr:sigma-70 family RNA polymerase sigma factor [Acidimicrobiia bacterium]
MAPSVRSRPQQNGARTRPAPPRDLSDEELLERVADSDPDATAAFVRRFERRVFGLAFTILGDSRAAEDVAQEALLRAWRHASAFDRRRGTVVSWLLTITRNLAIDTTRVRRPDAIAPDDGAFLTIAATGRSPAEAAEVQDDVERLRGALTDLPSEQRTAVVLAGMWGLTAREIAEREQIPLGTAKTRIRTGLGRLRAALVEELAASDGLERCS